MSRGHIRENCPTQCQYSPYSKQRSRSSLGIFSGPGRPRDRFAKSLGDLPEAVFVLSTLHEDWGESHLSQSSCPACPSLGMGPGTAPSPPPPGPGPLCPGLLPMLPVPPPPSSAQTGLLHRSFPAFWHAPGLAVSLSKQTSNQFIYPTFQACVCVCVNIYIYIYIYILLKMLSWL